MTMKKTKTFLVHIEKKTLTPITSIPKSRHHRFYWYLAMIMCGIALEAGELEEKREDILSHLLSVRDTHLDANSWDKTIQTQFESAYGITRRGNNNLFDKLNTQFCDYYEIQL